MASKPIRLILISFGTIKLIIDTGKRTVIANSLKDDILAEISYDELPKKYPGKIVQSSNDSLELWTGLSNNLVIKYRECLTIV